MNWHQRRQIWFYRALLASAGLLVPCSQRREWLAEWEAELWHLICRPERSVIAGWDQRPFGFCCGSFRDAMWLRQNRSDVERLDRAWLRSPILCLSTLAALAFLAVTLAWLRLDIPLPHDPRQSLFRHVLALSIAMLLVRLTSPFHFHGYPTHSDSADHSTRSYWWMFFAAKCALVLTIVFCGTFDLGFVFASDGVRPHANIIGYVLGFRWLLADQERRCPVCLRLLTRPVRIGAASHVMLEWYGTELMCQKGHGVLHVPQISTSSCDQHQWVGFDSSWRELFSR